MLFHQVSLQVFQTTEASPLKGCTPLTNQKKRKKLFSFFLFYLLKEINSFRIQNSLFGKSATDCPRHLQKIKSTVTFKSFKHHKTNFTLQID